MNLTRLIPIVAFCFLIVFASCSGNGNSEEQNISADVVHNPNTASGNAEESLPVITFEETEHDFGRIIEGETVSFTFTFTNTGKSDLILAEVTSSCGCTVPSYPKTPIRPGKKGEVKIAFNSNGRRGYQSKTVVVASNTQPNSTLLRIRAQVVNPGAEK